MRREARRTHARSVWLGGLATLLVSCATPPSATPTPTPDAPHQGHATAGPANHDVPRHPGADGTIVLENDFFTGGSGVGIDEAIRVASSQPVLVNGIILRDVDGAIWLCSAVAPSSPPSCGHPRLFVVNFSEAAAFDPSHADATGARSSDGIVWVEGHQLFGVVHP